MSKMIKCKTCRVDIAKSAKTCPSCGAKNKKPFYKKWWVFLIVILVIGGIIASGGKKDKDTSASKDGTETKETAKKEETKITYENFLSIKMGQSYADVANILGQGTEQSSSEISGIKTVMYTWNGSGIGNMNATVQNDIITGKAQVGLESMDAGITLEKYNQINNGMTYEQVKEILGEGQVLSQSKLMNYESIMYEYINKNGTNANFTFSENSLKMKTQFNLK